jgi:hypothetical protein
VYRDYLKYRYFRRGSQVGIVSVLSKFISLLKNDKTKLGNSRRV